MSRITLRLPATLHRELETLAQREHTSLNQYIGFCRKFSAVTFSTMLFCGNDRGEAS